ncbi:hypothetical protein RDABS01_019418, partial [Bienertia sinuspersici]
MSLRKTFSRRCHQILLPLVGGEIPRVWFVSAEDIITTTRKGSSSEIMSPDEKAAAVTGFSPSKTSQVSWSPESGDSFAAENLGKLDVRSPDRLAGE